MMLGLASSRILLGGACSRGLNRCSVRPRLQYLQLSLGVAGDERAELIGVGGNEDAVDPELTCSFLGGICGWLGLREDAVAGPGRQGGSRTASSGLQPAAIELCQCTVCD